MKNLSSEFCLKVKAARRERGLTQSELAAEIGCKQSALSMFEQGDGTKLNDEAIEKLAQKFGLTIAAAESNGGEVKISGQAMRHSGFCPNPHCPTNFEYFVDGVRLLRPDREAADPAGGRYCAQCGELLERKCSNCGAAVHSGSVCTFCGRPYVSVC